MPPFDAQEAAEKVRQVAELLGISPEQLLASGSRSPEIPEPVLGVQEPPHIVYPNIKFPPYIYREYPKLYYRGVVRDVEQPFILVKDGQQINAVKVVRDQFVYETLEVRNKNEEAMNTIGWFATYIEAKEHALAVREERDVVSEHGEGVTIRVAPPSQGAAEADVSPPARTRKGQRRDAA